MFLSIRETSCDFCLLMVPIFLIIVDLSFVNRRPGRIMLFFGSVPDKKSVSLRGIEKLCCFVVIWQITISSLGNVARTSAGRFLIELESVKGNGITTTSSLL